MQPQHVGLSVEELWLTLAGTGPHEGIPMDYLDKCDYEPMAVRRVRCLNCGCWYELEEYDTNECPRCFYRPEDYMAAEPDEE